MQSAILLFVIALVANFFSAVAGGGAGLLQLPILIFLGLPFAAALATHKVATVALGLGASIKHIKAGNFDKKRSLLVLGVGLPCVFIGAMSSVVIPDHISNILLGLLTIGLGLYSIFSPSLGQLNNLKPLSPKVVLIGSAVLAAIGFVNGAFSSGSGLFVTLWLVRYFGFDYKSAVAHTLVWVGIAWNFTGALSLGWLGQIYWAWIIPLALGSFVGGYLGASMADTMGNRFVKRSFEVVTLITGIALIAKTLA